MAVRTVRLGDADEVALERVRRATGAPISEIFKRGLRLLEEQSAKQPPSFWEVYSQLDLGSGGYSLVPAAQAKAAVKEIIRKKHGR